jgi:hypothetical protein
MFRLLAERRVASPADWIKTSLVELKESDEVFIERCESAAEPAEN